MRCDALIFLSLVLPAAALAAAPKAEATEAFHRGDFARACPLFEAVVAKAPFDAWGWNDLALCRIKALELGHVLAPLDRAKALEHAVGVPKLAAALAFNEDLYSRVLLAHPTAAGLSPDALTQARREFERWGAAITEAEDLHRVGGRPGQSAADAGAEQQALRATAAAHRDVARRLFELCLASPEPFPFTLDDWNHLGELRVEHAEPARALEAFLEAAKVGQVSSTASALPSWQPTESEAPLLTAQLKRLPWLSRCTLLDERRRCGKAWLACAPPPSPPPEEPEPWTPHLEGAWVFVDADALEHLTFDPTLSAQSEGEHTAPSWVVSEHHVDPERCSIDLGHGEYMSSGLNDYEQSVRPVALDVCEGTVTEVQLQGACTEVQLLLSVRPLVPVH
jgi:hypothetical protein